MEIKIPTKKRKLVLNFQLNADNRMMVRAVGYDKEKQNTFYFDRSEQIAPGRNTLIFPLPISPNTLYVKFHDMITELPVSEADLSVTELKQQINHRDPMVKKFFEFAEWFSVNAGTLRHGPYNCHCGGFWINYMDRIIDDEEGEQFTPARIEREIDEIQIASKKFRGYTIFMRPVILTHEFFHNYDNTSDETQADLRAIDLLMSMGYPTWEIENAFEKVFSDNLENMRRMRIIKEHIASKGNYMPFAHNGRQMITSA